MERIREFLAMGGYAVYVWPAYLIAALVMGGQVAVTLRALRRREAALSALERTNARTNERTNPGRPQKPGRTKARQ
jgi:heme exporter protein D